MSDQKTYLANLALHLCQMDPKTFGGIVFKTGACAHMDRVRSALSQSESGSKIINPSMGVSDLIGGIDPIESLTAGTLIHKSGVLSRSGWNVLVMAERLPRQSAALIAQHMDTNRTDPFCIFDESEPNEENQLGALNERMAFFFDLNDLRHDEFSVDITPISSVGRVLPELSPDQQTMIVSVALQFGIISLRPVAMVQRAAQYLCLLDGRDTVSQDDIDTAAQLIYAHRATSIPAEEDNTEPQNEPTEPNNSTDTSTENDTLELPEDLVIEAVKAILPKDILNQITAKKIAKLKSNGDGFGLAQKSALRGRPLPALIGWPNDQARIDILSSLRTAAPWQTLRRSQSSSNARIIIFPSDLHIQRFQNRSERVVIFSVDASGSAAMNRLGEAKGAVELMLAQAYSKRDHVALIGFRDGRADILLPPTRSLVQAKKNLAALAAGGGTPLAMGMNSALNLAALVRRSGKLPSMAFLTDGKGNIDLEGQPGRQKAMSDAAHIAEMGRTLNIPSIFIDCGRRGNPELAHIADKMGGQYLCLPRANAQAISALAQSHLE
ncbi:VWA domain-containing protein [Paracoccaceae bacterium]|nr:VWA domain-containing protein [Paracoccaceae bacterium]